MTPSWLAPPKRTDAKAVVSLFLGLTSFVFGPATGLPALILGSIARRDIDRSGGALKGGSIAAAGTLAGLFGTGLVAVVLLWLGSAIVLPQQSAAIPAVDESAAQAKVHAATPAVTHEKRDLEILHYKR